MEAPPQEASSLLFLQDQDAFAWRSPGDRKLRPKPGVPKSLSLQGNWMHLRKPRAGGTGGGAGRRCDPQLGIPRIWFLSQPPLRVQDTRTPALSSENRVPSVVTG